MSKHLVREIEKLKKMILGLAAVVELSVDRAVKAIERRDVRLAQTVLDGDPEIDHLEVDVEEECLKLLALNQPVANDLRFLVAVLKINNDLERIGDLAVNIAERAVFLAEKPRPEPELNFAIMEQKAQSMLRRSLDSLINHDSALAREVCVADDEVDALHRKMCEDIVAACHQHPLHLDSLVHLLGVSRHLERIADHATNIAEDVIYMIEGEIVRHRPEDFRPPSKPKA